MADFDTAVAKTIENEGGDKYIETQDDKGGATKYGISLKFLIDLHEKYHFLSGKPDRKTISDLCLSQAKYIYKEYFWDANRYGEIKMQYIADKIFDLSVLFGSFVVNKVFQESLNYLNLGRYPKLKEDGIIGNMTLSTINLEYDQEYSLMDVEVRFEYLMAKYCLSICNKDKSQSKFLLGWLNRVMS